MPIIFRKSGLSDLTIEKARSYPINEPIEFNQERYLTEDNKAKVVNFGSELNLIVVVLEDLPYQNYKDVTNGLVNWFKNPNINGSLNNFTMIDEKGETHTVRLWQDRLEVRETYPGGFSVEMTLLKEG